MNKLKMLSVALMCVCGLNLMSCVDDEESQSVENIRNAKAALLNAKAELEKANAEAVLLMAQADAAIKNAEAAYRQALADQETAKAEIAKATLEMEIEAAKLKAQAALEQAKADAVNNADLYSSALYTKYSAAVQKVFDKTLEKITAQKNLLNAKYKLENFDVLTASRAAYLKKQIALSEAKIAEYQKMSDAGKEAIDAAYLTAWAEADRLLKEQTDASNAAQLASQNMLAAQRVLDNAAYTKAVEVFVNYPGSNVVRKYETYTKEEKGEAADGYEDSSTANFQFLLPVDEKEVAICMVNQEEVVKAANADFVGVDTTYQNLNKKVEEAYHSYDTAKAENKATYLSAYQSAKAAAENYYTTNYEPKSDALKAAQEQLDELKAAKEALATYSTTYQAAVDALKKETDAWVKADLTSKIKGYEYGVADARSSALSNLFNNNTSSVEELIATEKKNIENYNNQLAQLTEYYYDGNNAQYLTEEGWKVLVAQLEKQVADLEGEIAKAQADADYYKSLIEAEAGKGEA